MAFKIKSPFKFEKFPPSKEGEPIQPERKNAKDFVIDPYKSSRREIIQSRIGGDPADPTYTSSNIGNEIADQAVKRSRQVNKPASEKTKYKSNRRNNKNKGSVGGSIGYSTPWRRYRDAVKDFKQKEIKEKTDPFTQERRLAKQDLRGKFDSTGRRLSAKNVYQQKYLVNRRRGRDGNTQRGFHNPHIPEFKNKVSFAEFRQNKRNQKQINAGRVKTGGCTPSGGKFTGSYKGKSTDTFGHGSQCGPGGRIR